jgi:hypothetical protein
MYHRTEHVGPYRSSHCEVERACPNHGAIRLLNPKVRALISNHEDLVEAKLGRPRGVVKPWDDQYILDEKPERHFFAPDFCDYSG